MRTLYADKGITSIQVGVSIALVLLLSFIVVFLLKHEDANWLQSAFETSVKKLQILQTRSSPSGDTIIPRNHASSVNPLTVLRQHSYFLSLTTPLSV